MNQLQLETKITAKFHPMKPLSPQEQVSLDALNRHAAEMAERLQTTLRLLITEMLDIKRMALHKEEYHAGSEQIDLPSNDRTDSESVV